MPRTASFMCFVLLLTAPAWSAAQANPAIGRVLLSRGTVEAMDAAGQPRKLVRRGEIFAGDTLVSGNDSFIQIRLIDSAMIALREDSEFTFHEYAFDGDPATPDRVVLELVRGGFRTITGSVGDGAGDVYEMITPAVDIAVRGTTFECVVDSGGTLCGVYDGGISLTNSAGSLDLGLGANGDFAETADRVSPPVLLLTSPSQLGNTITINRGTSRAVRLPGPAVTTANPALQSRGTSPISNTPLPANPTPPAPQNIRIVPYRK